MSESNPRYIPNDGSLKTIHDPHGELQKSLERIVHSVPPSAENWRFYGIYEGPTSIAYLFLALSKSYPDLQINGVTLKEWSIRYLEVGSGRVGEDPTPGNCGILTEKLCHLAVTAAAKQDYAVASSLCDWSRVVLTDGGTDYCNDWAYGRAGYLYLLRLVKTHLPWPPSQMELHSRIEAISVEVIEKITSYPQPWIYRGRGYIGPGHGTLGIITQIVLTNHSYAPRLEPVLSGLLKLRLPSGNWPSVLEEPDDDTRVQFCHGAPGFAISLMSIKEHFPNLQNEIDLCIEKARECTWTYGLLTKDPNLCHGIAGNALAFDDSKRFDHFVGYLTQDEVQMAFKNKILKESDMPFSLLCGEAGRAWIWAIADGKIEKKFATYDDL